MSTLRKLLADRSGAMLVETALIAPALLLLGVGGFQVSEVVSHQHMLEAAAAEAEQIALAEKPDSSAKLDNHEVGPCRDDRPFRKPGHAVVQLSLRDQQHDGDQFIVLRFGHPRMELCAHRAHRHLFADVDRLRRGTKHFASGRPDGADLVSTWQRLR